VSGSPCLSFPPLILSLVVYDEEEDTEEKREKERLLMKKREQQIYDLISRMQAKSTFNLVCSSVILWRTQS